MTEQQQPPATIQDLAQVFMPSETQDNAPDVQDSDHAAPPAGDNAETPDAQPFEDAEGHDEGDALSDDDDVDASEEVKSEPKTSTEAVTVKLPDGQTVTLTPSEIANGYLRQQDYSRKTAEHAEKVRTFEAEAVSIKQQQLHVLEGLQQRFQQLDPIGLLRNSYHEAMDNGDTDQALRIKDKIEELSIEQHRIEQALAHENAQKEQQNKANAEEFLSKQRDALFEKMPFLKDEKRLNTFKESTAKALKKVGYSDSELAELGKAPDHRQAMLAYYAGQYLKGLESRPQAAQALKGKIVSPSANARGSSDKKQSALSNFDKNPNDLRSLAAVLSL